MRLLYVSCASLLVSCSIVTDYGGAQSCEESSECAAGEECGEGLCRPAVGSAGGNEPPEQPLPSESEDEEPPEDPAGNDVVVEPGGDVVVSGPDLTRDTHVRFLEPANNFGEAPELVSDADPLTRALLRFRLGEVPALAPGVQVVGARIALQVTDDFDGADVTVYAVNEAWAEGRATYILRRADSAWSTPGGLNEGAQIPLAVATPVGLGPLSIEIPAEIVQRWIDDPESNLGLWLASSSQEGRGGRFESSESAGAPPALTVTIALP